MANKLVRPGEIRVLPHAHPLNEEAILGALMMEKMAFSRIQRFMRAEFFYNSFHAEVYTVIETLWRRGTQPDIINVTAEMVSTYYPQFKLPSGNNVAFEVTRLTNAVVSSANLENHCYMVIKFWMKRRLILDAMKVIEMAYDETTNAFEVRDIAAQQNMDIFEAAHASKAGLSYSELAFVRMQEIEANDGSRPMYLNSGLKNFDDILQGFTPVLHLWAARPSMGKTALMVDMVERLSSGIPGLQDPAVVSVFELETNSNTFIDRHYGNKTGIDTRRLRAGNLTKQEIEKLHEAMIEIDNQKILAEFVPRIDTDYLRAKIRYQIDKFGCQIVLIDYVQLMGVKKASQRLMRERQVAEIAEELAAMTVEFNIPIIGLAQLSRATANRATKKPELQDIRETGQLEAASRTVAAIHRPGYYGILDDEQGNAYPDGYTEIHYLKNNEGDTGVAQLVFDKTTSKFRDYNPNSWQQLGQW